MKIKKEYLILGVIIIALVAYLTLRNTDRTHYRLPALEIIPAEGVTKIEIKSPASTITLSKKADKWFVSPEQYPADGKKIRQMADVIGALTLTALVSESKSDYRYDLAEDKKITITAWSGDTKSRQFDLGKTASSFKHTFVKIADDPRVYHARDNFRHTFDVTVDSLREKSVLDFEIKDIREIHIAKGDQKKVFTRIDPSAPDEDKTNRDDDESKKAPVQPVWQGLNGETPDVAEVNRFLTTLNGLECDKYIYGRSKDDLKDPIYTVELKGTKDHVLSLFGQKDKENDPYPAVTSENAYPFELTTFRADNIMKSFEKKEETPEK